MPVTKGKLPFITKTRVKQEHSGLFVLTQRKLYGLLRVLENGVSLREKDFS